MYNDFMPKELKDTPMNGSDVNFFENENAPVTLDSSKGQGKNSGVPKATFKKFDKKGKFKLPFSPAVLGIFVAAILALGLFYFFGTSRSGDVINPGGSSPVEDADLLLQNPLTGVMYKESEAGPINERPLAVMMNNHVDARPQSGLVDADLTYEIVAEGGITRLIPFYLSKTPKKIGPVRSTRDYYLVYVKELGDAMIMHIGWSPKALQAIQEWPVRSLGRGNAQFWRDNPRNVAVEHTAYVDGEYLRELGKELGWEGRRDFVVWKFKDDAPSSSPTAKSISIDFWSRGDYSTIFKYDATNNSYLRFNGYDSSGEPIPTKDQESGEQVSVKTVIVQFATENAIPGDDSSRLSYELIGSGSGIVFMDGTATQVTWSKSDRDERTMFYDLNGEEIEFNRGKIWISIVPDRNISQVQYN